MAVYFLRHGQSEANEKGVFAGQINNCPLTDLGMQQCRAVAQEIKSLGIDRIIASNLTRARQTAAEVAKIIGFDESKIETDSRINEYNMGSITGTPIRAVTSDELNNAKGAEDPTEFQNRILSFLRQYKDSHGNVLMVSHSGVDAMIQATKLGMEPDELYSNPLYPNAHATKLDLDWLQ